MKKILIYSKNQCPFCVMAKRFLNSKKVSYQEIDVNNNPQMLNEMIEKSHRKTVPQIFIGETHVGGYTDLMDLEQKGNFEDLIK